MPMIKKIPKIKASSKLESNIAITDTSPPISAKPKPTHRNIGTIPLCHCIIDRLILDVNRTGNN